MNEAYDIPAPVWRAHVAEPKPAVCSGCLRGADAETVFIDLGTPAGRGFIREWGSMAVLVELNRICLCESCVKEMAELLAFKPTLHEKHYRKLREVMDLANRLEAENEQLRKVVTARLAA